MTPRPIGAPPLILPFDLTDISGAKVREDHQAAAIGVVTSDGDRLMLGMSVGMVDAMLETLGKIRTELNAKGVEQTISFRAVHSASVGDTTLEGIPFVLLTIDRKLPTAVAYLMPPKNAAIVGKALRQRGREIQAARSDKPEAGDEEDAAGPAA